jgi:hypothetical protein
MTSKPNMNVALRLTGLGFSPEDVTDMIGLAPTRTWRLGDSVQGTRLTRKHDGWVFELPYRETYDMDSLVRELLDAVEPYKNKIEAASSRFGLDREISFGVYVRDEAPTSWFAADTLSRVATLKANLDIDMILLGEKPTQRRTRSLR